MTFANHSNNSSMQQALRAANRGGFRAPTTTENVADKLHGMADSFRRERDEAHRRQLTATERLLLAQQEANAMAATVQALENNYKQLQQQAGADIEAEVQTLANQVELSTKEMQFQHAELVDKRDKMTQLQRDHGLAEQKRKDAINNITKTLMQQRTKHQQNLKVAAEDTSFLLTPTLEMTQKKALESELANDLDGHYLKEKWPRLVRDKAQALQAQNLQKQRACETLERVVEGYQRHFQVTVDENGQENGAGATNIMNKSATLEESHASSQGIEVDSAAKGGLNNPNMIQQQTTGAAAAMAS